MDLIELNFDRLSPRGSLGLKVSTEAAILSTALRSKSRFKASLELRPEPDFFLAGDRPRGAAEVRFGSSVSRTAFVAPVSGFFARSIDFQSSFLSCYPGNKL